MSDGNPLFFVLNNPGGTGSGVFWQTNCAFLVGLPVVARSSSCTFLFSYSRPRKTFKYFLPFSPLLFVSISQVALLGTPFLLVSFKSNCIWFVIRYR